MVFTLVQSVPFPPLGVSLDSYAHHSGLMLHISRIQGPISHAYIVVPTETNNDMGLPHTLEHLIFLGSKNNPYRGYLDQVAARCLTTGTNAYTMDDHTCYCISTAGQQGLLTILPLLLDYVLHPTLTDENFVTEIYHIDGEGREQGVVYCEMLGRENTEKDLLDLNVNSLLFPNTAYSKASGGLTPDIAKLDNNMIRDYHKSMYHPSNMSIVLLGQIDVEMVFKSLETVEIQTSSSIPFTLPWSDPIPPLTESVSKNCSFPSEDASVGTVCFGWRGPPIEDFQTIASLCVLFRYLHETSASPIQRRFVEREDPLASSAYFSIKNSKVTGIVLEFTGVPTNRDEDDSDESGDESDDDDDSDDDDSEDDDETDGDESDSDDESNLFVSGSIQKRLMKLLIKIRDNGFPEGPDIITKTIQREGVKFLESIEDDSSEAILALLFPDLVFPGKRLPTQRIQQQEILKDLLEKPTQFWLDLLDKWLIKQPIVEVIMKPDTEMAKKMAEETHRKIEERVEKLGPLGLQVLKTRLEECIKENHKPLPDSIVFPDIPAPSTIPILPVESKIWFPVSSGSSKKVEKVENSPPHFSFGEELADFPFPVQLISVDTQFVHFKVIFDISNLPIELRPYLVLFQELILETALEIPQENKKPLFVPHTEVALQLNEQVVSVEGGVGFDNRGFSASCIPDLFYLYFVSEKDKIDQVCSWIIKILFYTVFPKSRISSMVSNLLSDVSEDLRDGSAVLGTLYTFALEPTHTKNEIAISTFAQKKFLSKIKKGLKSNKKNVVKKSRGKKKIQRVIFEELDEKEVRERLEQIRDYLLDDSGRVFGQISKPFGQETPLLQLQQHWKKAIQIRTQPKIHNNNNNKIINNNTNNRRAKHKNKKGKKPARGSNSKNKNKNNKNNNSIQKHTLSSSPNFILHFRARQNTPFPPVKILTPIGGVDSSFILQMIHCNVTKKDPDFFPIVVLGEIMTSSEGPLYNEIRGKGYAYDASIGLHLWTQSISLSLHECSAPFKALSEFYKIIQSIPEKFTQFEIETARASLIYQFHRSRSSPPEVLGSVLMAFFKGFESLQQEFEYETEIFKVDKNDLMRVYEKYFVKFLDQSSRSILITTNPSSTKTITEEFKNPPLNVDLNVTEIEQLLI